MLFPLFIQRGNSTACFLHQSRTPATQIDFIAKIMEPLEQLFN
jgi:hypothetical protein